MTRLHLIAFLLGLLIGIMIIFIPNTQLINKYRDLSTKQNDLLLKQNQRINLLTDKLKECYENENSTKETNE